MIATDFIHSVQNRLNNTKQAHLMLESLFKHFRSHKYTHIHTIWTASETGTRQNEVSAILVIRFIYK